jgi:hypothetical protein
MVKSMINKQVSEVNGMPMEKAHYKNVVEHATGYRLQNCFKGQAKWNPRRNDTLFGILTCSKANRTEQERNESVTCCSNVLFCHL